MIDARLAAMDTRDLRPKWWQCAWRAFAAGALAVPLLLPFSASAAPAKSLGDPEDAIPAPPAQNVLAQAQPTQQRGQPARPRGIKLGEASFLVPGGYLDRSSDFGSKKSPVIPLQALLPDLRPRAEGQGGCAPTANACPDFAVIRLRPGTSTLEKDFTQRYKAGPANVGSLPAAYGLRQVPPHKAQPADGRQFLAQPEGRWVWIVCRDFGRPTPKRPAPPGACRLAFDTADGLAVSVRFDKKKLPDWAAIHAKTAALVADLKQ